MKTVYEDNDVIVKLEWFEELKAYTIHTEVHNWSLSKYKKYIHILGKILNNLKSEGHTKLYAIPPTEKEQKWEELFGFKETCMTYGNYKIMELDYGT